MSDTTSKSGIPIRLPDERWAHIMEEHAEPAEMRERMIVHEYLKLLPALQNAPAGAMWMHYDAEADVLYVNFARPSVATDSELTDDDVIIRYDEQDQVIGYTILHARKRSA